MKVFLGRPPRHLLQVALRALGEPAPLVILPTGVANLPLRLPEVPSMEWQGFWHSLIGSPRLTGLTAAHLAVCAEVCQRILSEGDYFGKVRRSPQFHRQLCARWIEWRMDGLDPERLEQAAHAIVQPPYAEIAGIESAALRDEWLRKASELSTLWREWERELQNRHLPNPGVGWWEAVAFVRQRRVSPPPRMLLWGFHELHTVDIALLHAVERAGCEVVFALLYDPTSPDRFAPVVQLLTRLQPDAVETLPDPAESGLSVDLPERMVLSAADSLREVEIVARQILHHTQQGVPPEQMLILLRHPASQAELLQVIFERYGIPFALVASQPLTRSPLVRLLLDALRLLIGDGVGGDWLQWLQSPYLGWSREVHHRLGTVSKRVRPADEWLDEAVRRMAEEPAIAEVLVWLGALRGLLRQSSPDITAVLTALVQRLMPSSSDLAAQNDRAAADALLEFARAYAPLWQRMTPAGAIAQLARLCDAEQYSHAWGREGVRVLPLELAGLAQAEIVFIMGLVEGMLPRRHPDDPFLRESERRALRAFFEAQGERVYLPLRSERQRLEPMLFYEATSAATQRLYLSYPRTMETGETLPSSYLQTLQSPVETRFYRLEELVPPPSERLHPYDRALAHALESAGAGMADVSELSDRLTLPRTRQRVVDIDRTFSVSELETLYRCPFQHLFRHRLRVRMPHRGLHLTQIGSVLHAALRHAYRHHRHLPPDSPEWAQALIDSLGRVVDAESLDLAHWQLQVLHAYATRLLQLFAQREPRYRQQFGLEPRHFEWAFGTPIADDEENPLLPSELSMLAEPAGRFDPDSVPNAYRLALGGGRFVRVSGVVDRVDFSPDGKVAMVTDYKLTRSPQRSEIEAGVAFQPLLYALTVQARYRPERVVIAFDELAHGRRVRFVPYDEGLIRRFRAGAWEGSPTEVMMVISQPRLAQAIEKLRTELRHLLELLQQATVVPTPGEHCRRCAFGDLCRKAQR